MIDEEDRIKGALLAYMDLLKEGIPLEVFEIIEQNAYIAGGAIVSLALNEIVHDIDIFFKGADSAQKVKQYFKECDSPYVKALTDNGITFRASTGVFQFVTRFTGPVDRVFTSFDFEHCKAYFDLATHDLVYNKDIIYNKKLVYTGEDEYPVNTLKRLVRFVRRGWRPSNDTILNLATKLNSIDFKSEEGRAQQLIGFYGSSME